MSLNIWAVRAHGAGCCPKYIACTGSSPWCNRSSHRIRTTRDLEKERPLHELSERVKEYCDVLNTYLDVEIWKYHDNKEKSAR